MSEYKGVKLHGYTGLSPVRAIRILKYENLESEKIVHKDKGYSGKHCDTKKGIFRKYVHTYRRFRPG